MGTEIVVKRFDYPDTDTCHYCEDAAERIRTLVRATVVHLVWIGDILEGVKARLPHGQYESWIENVLGLSKTTALKCKKLASHSRCWPALLEFESTEAAQEFVDLEPDERDEILKKRAFTWTKFQATLTRVRCEKRKQEYAEHLCRDDHTPEESTGDVAEWVKEDFQNPYVADAAREWWEENRERVARLSDRHPAEMDAEIGYKPVASERQSGFVRGESGLWLARKGLNGEAIWLGEIEQVVELWPGPRTALALLRDGPATAAFNTAVLEAAIRAGLVVVTPQTIEGQVRSLYGEVEIL